MCINIIRKSNNNYEIAKFIVLDNFAFQLFEVRLEVLCHRFWVNNISLMKKLGNHEI